MNTLENLFVSLATCMLIFGMFAFVIKVSAKQEKADCLQLQEYAGKYSEFYITKWQKEMCDQQDIIINAPVK